MGRAGPCWANTSRALTAGWAQKHHDLSRHREREEAIEDFFGGTACVGQLGLCLTCEAFASITLATNAQDTQPQRAKPRHASQCISPRRHVVGATNVVGPRLGRSFPVVSVATPRGKLASKLEARYSISGEDRDGACFRGVVPSWSLWS